MTIGIKWTNESVKHFAGTADPIDAVTTCARDLVLRAIDQGWTGPPFDPFVLADLLHLETVPRADISDARTLPVSRSQLRIEFNPNRPHARVRYSVAHEIAHTLFPDCAHQIRNRSMHQEKRGDEWQLEALCNIAAAEFLVPLGSLSHSQTEHLTIDKALQLRPDLVVLDVSMPVMNGLQAARELQRLMPKLPILMFTNFSSSQIEREALAVGVTAVKSKSDSVDSLCGSIRGLLESA